MKFFVSFEVEGEDLDNLGVNFESHNGAIHSIANLVITEYPHFTLTEEAKGLLAKKVDTGTHPRDITV